MAVSDRFTQSIKLAPSRNSGDANTEWQSSNEDLSPFRQIAGGSPLLLSPADHTSDAGRAGDDIIPDPVVELPAIKISLNLIKRCAPAGDISLAHPRPGIITSREQSFTSSTSMPINAPLAAEFYLLPERKK